MNIIPSQKDEDRRSCSLSIDIVSHVEKSDTLGGSRGFRGIDGSVLPSCVSRDEYISRTLNAERQVQMQRKAADKGPFKRMVKRFKAAAAVFVSHYYGIAHIILYVFLGLLGGLIIYGIERRGRLKMSFTDALFTGYSSITATGLMTVDFVQTRGGTKAIVLMLFSFGSQIMDSLLLISLKRYLWKKPPLISNLDQVQPAPKRKSIHAFSMESSSTVLDNHRINQFHALLTHRQERDALNLLIWIKIGYWFGMLFLAFIVYSICIASSPGLGKEIGERYTNGGGTAWVAFFMGCSSLTNAGISLFSDSYTIFAKSHFMLVFTVFILVFGNTGYPILLRGVVRLISIITKRISGERAERIHRLTKYILRFPRRLTVSLFPMRQTLILLGILVAITVVQCVDFLATDWSFLPSTLNVGEKLLNTFFQSICTRTTGFNTLDLSTLSQSTLVMFAIMMYIAVVPNVITMRFTRDSNDTSNENSNDKKKKKDEKDKKKKKDDDDSSSSDSSSSSSDSDDEEDDGVIGSIRESMPAPTTKEGVGFHLKRMILFDTTWIFLPWYIISVVEDKKFKSDSQNFTPFKVFFEVMSAYGTVGYSCGYPGLSSSFVGSMRNFSKYVIMIVMLMGRHRNLPDNIDQAILPSCLPLVEDRKIRDKSAKFIKETENMKAFNHLVTSSEALKEPRLSIGRKSFSSQRRKVSAEMDTLLPNRASSSSGSTRAKRSRRTASTTGTETHIPNIMVSPPFGGAVPMSTATSTRISPSSSSHHFDKGDSSRAGSMDIDMVKRDGAVKGSVLNLDDPPYASRHASFDYSSSSSSGPHPKHPHGILKKSPRNQGSASSGLSKVRFYNSKDPEVVVEDSDSSSDTTSSSSEYESDGNEDNDSVSDQTSVRGRSVEITMHEKTKKRDGTFSRRESLDVKPARTKSLDKDEDNSNHSNDSDNGGGRKKVHFSLDK